MAIEPEWLSEIVPRDLRVAFMEHVERNNDDFRKTLLHATWRSLLEQHILNEFNLNGALPYEAECPHKWTWMQIAELWTWVFFRDHLNRLLIDQHEVSIVHTDEVIDTICWQCGWLEDKYDEFPKLPQYRWSTNGGTWEYRDVHDLVEVGTQWMTRDYYEYAYQPRLPGGF